MNMRIKTLKLNRNILNTSHLVNFYDINIFLQNMSEKIICNFQNIIFPFVTINKINSSVSN